MQIDNGTFPMQHSIGDDNKVANWRPLAHWAMAIPHLIVASILGFVAMIVVFISWFMIVITGKMNEGMANLIAMSLRYSTRTNGFMYGLSEQYPPFNFDTVAADPGDYDITLSVQPALEDRNRVTVLLRIFMLIPLIIVMYIYNIVFSVIALIAWFAVLFTGAYPEGLRNIALGYSNFGNRMGAYGTLLTDEYPGFGLTS